MSDTEYYIIEPAFQGNDPMLAFGDDEVENALMALEEPMTDTFVIIDQHGKDIFNPRAYHYCYGILATEPLASTLQQAASNLQSYTAEIRVGAQPNTDYTFLHIPTDIAAVDREASDVDWAPRAKRAFGIKSLVLNPKSWQDIPEAERIIFRLGEKSSALLVHASLAETLNPTDYGNAFKLYHPSEWNSNVGFQDTALNLN